MLTRHLPLAVVADIINELDLTPQQVRQTTASVLHIVHRAWRHRPISQQDRSFEEFADRIPRCHWPLMFEACALGHLGRRHEAHVLAQAAQVLEGARSAGTRPNGDLPLAAAA
ncbi:hypothetical protein ACFY1P_29290 [Streptomyces sp. NPDC001407]|uniref:hypothetical protein n=1 Tax=unclassified Streptomyces TaxID=2593676 RepID=UPI0036924EF9